MSDARTVVFVGAGAMGSRMAPLVAERYRTIVVDLDAAKREAMRDRGLEVSERLDAVAAEADVLVLLLPNSAAVEATVTEELLTTLPSGAVILDMGSSRPASTVEIAALAARNGVGFVDAPVSGGTRKAADGTLTTMVGGDLPTLERVRPVLSLMTEELFYLGAAGSGHTMKALNNLLSAITMAGTTEVLRVGTAAGLDPQTMLDVINVSTGANHASKSKFSQFVLSGTYASGFALDLMVKDLLTATDAAHHVGQSVPVAASTLEAWLAAQSGLPAGSDHTEFARRWADALNNRGAAAPGPAPLAFKPQHQEV
ncbi:MAG: NAD(P)-dependent oxidoreductase [Actinomycetota bacterium]